VGALAGVGLLAALAACEIVELDTLTVVEPPDSPVTVQAVAGNGGSAFVAVTEPTDQFPSAGLWRVGRTSTFQTKLAGITGSDPANRVFRTNSTGDRALYSVKSSPNNLWTNTCGSFGFLDRPYGVSDDLRSSFVYSQTTVPNAFVLDATSCELRAVGLPAFPSGTSPRDLDVTSDGNRLTYVLGGGTCATPATLRIQQQTPAVVHDIAYDACNDRYAFPDTGTVLAHYRASEHDVQVLDPITGELLREVDLEPGTSVDQLLFSENSWFVWVVQRHGTLTDVVAFDAHEGLTAFEDLELGQGTARTDLTPNGRFLVLERQNGSTWGPPAVLDYYTGHVELLEPGVDGHLPVDPHIADGGRLVVASTDTATPSGWLEYAP
jgi:hypothetical protein